MRKYIKYLICTTMVIIMIISMCIGLQIKKTWKDDTNIRDSLTNNKLQQTINTHDDYYFLLPKDVDTYEKLCDTADIIVRVKVNPELDRKIYTYATLSTVDIVKVYKGKTNEHKISVFEPGCVVHNDIVNTIGSYQLMNDNYEYVLFLKECDSKLYNNGKVYIPTTTGLSKYCCNDNMIVGKSETVENDTVLYYNNLSKFDALARNQEEKAMYENNKKSLEETFLKGDK